MPRRPATNLIQRALDRLRIDWRSPRYGRPRMPGEAAVIVVPDVEAFGPLLSPMRADGRIGLDARQPPAVFRADAWRPAPFWRNAPRHNLARTAAVMEELLGPPETAHDGGAEILRWHDQAGSVTLACWPDGARDGHPHGSRHAEACAITIVPGWRRPLSDTEMAAVSGMIVMGRGTPRGVRALAITPAGDDDSAYVREPGPDPATLDAVVGYDPVTSMLVACPGKLLVLPLDAVRGLRHESAEDAVAGRRSGIHAALADDREILLVEHVETHGLDLVARSMARTLRIDVSRTDAIAS